MSNTPDYEVIVVGGGPAGITAATQAARAGARTLLVEKSGVLGGTTTLNGVNFPGLFHAWGTQIIAGIGWELVTATIAEEGGTLPDFNNRTGERHWEQQILVSPAIYAALADRLVVDSGAALRFHTMLASVERDDAADQWVVRLCGKGGLDRVTSRVLIDTTGDANVVALAGLPLRRNPHLQPGTLMLEAGGYTMDSLDLEALEKEFLAAVERGEIRRPDLHASEGPVASFLKGRGRNGMHVPGIDASTSAGKTAAELEARAALLRIQRFFRRQPGLEGFRIEQCCTECGIRETYTIEGEVCVTEADYTSGKEWPDALCYSFYPVDVHDADGIGIDIRPLKPGVVPTLPLRAMLPQGSRNLLVAGRCACGDQAAHSAFRVQASCMAMGQAVGAVAALAATSNREVRAVPLDSIRALLREQGAIVPDVQES